MEDLKFGLWLGVGLTAAVAVFIAAVAWRDGERECEKQHDVFDCEWSGTPFTPVSKENDDDI